MRKIAIGLAVALLAVALHAVAMGLWHDNHSAPFHAGQVMLTCPMGYVCPVSPAVLKMALVSPSPETFKGLASLFAVVCAFLFAYATVRRHDPPYATTPASPSGLRSTFKKE